MDNGQLIISLDYELHWGFFDKKSINQYSDNLINVPKVITRLLELSSKYQVRLTFATVGFLFAKNKNELIQYSPSKKPNYENALLNAYNLIDSIGINEYDDPYHYAHSSLKSINQNGAHEICTHTFCHYYCNENGQTKEEFNADIISAKKIATNFGVDLKSIVFPRNQVHNEYLKICSQNNISSYRGTEKAKMYSISPRSKHYNSPVFRIARLLDSYTNITGQNTYDTIKINLDQSIVNLPSSRFLRPYNKKLRILESIKLRRIKKGMTHAAKNNQLYHLWWHPHNFGKHIDENFKNLEDIFIQYQTLNKKYGFKSETMSSLASKVLTKI